MNFLKVKVALYPIKWIFISFKIVSLTSLKYFLFYNKKKALVPIGIKELGNSDIYIRASSKTDREVIKYVYYDKYHLPPSKLKENCIILDFGSNIGLTLRHFAQIYPCGKIYGFEMDKNNYSICRKNCEGVANISIQNRAVWTKRTIISYNTNSNSDAYTISRDDALLANEKVEALTISDIINEEQFDRIDYIKMDIEGAEIEILKGDLTWANSVSLMNIEIHDKKFINPAMMILTKAGFECWKHPSHSFSIYAKNLTTHLSYQNH